VSLYFKLYISVSQYTSIAKNMQYFNINNINYNNVMLILHMIML